MNHPFIDGNKRSGISAGIYFLSINGWKLKVSQEELVKAALAIASKKWTLEEVSDWLKEYSIKA